MSKCLIDNCVAPGCKPCPTDGEIIAALRQELTLYKEEVDHSLIEIDALREALEAIKKSGHTSGWPRG